MNQVIDLMLKYPTVLPVNAEKTEFRGYLPVNGVDYEIHIKEVDRTFSFCTPHPPCLTTLNSRNVIQLLDSARNIIAANVTTQKSKNLAGIYRHILLEYMELREFYINIYKCSVSQDLSEVKIVHLDEYNRLHDLVILMDFDGEVFRVKHHSLPENKNEDLFKPSNSLKVIYEKFIGVVEELQGLFNTFDVFDRNCWILDPEKPTRKNCYRRIGLDLNVSIIVTFDPWSKASIPDIKFLGPERLIEDFRQKVAKNLINWDHNSNMVDEILSLLELSSFPKSPVNESKEEILLCDAGECCICFSLRLNDKLPEIICQNSSCEQFFHTECLYQWLISVNAKQSFNELHGQCPNCEKQIFCPL